MFKSLTKYNYLVPVYLFLHYLLRTGNEVKIKFNKPDYEISKFSAIYLALGHFNYENHYDIYDFNENEWPRFLIKIGKPFIVRW